METGQPKSSGIGRKNKSRNTSSLEMATTMLTTERGSQRHNSIQYQQGSRTRAGVLWGEQKVSRLIMRNRFFDLGIECFCAISPGLIYSSSMIQSSGKQGESEVIILDGKYVAMGKCI